MIRTIKIDLSAANPQLPLQPVELFEGSAATLVLLNIPRSLGKRTITAVSVVVINPDSKAQAYEATREGSAYQVTIPAEAFGGSGSVENGIMISASGVNERGETVDQWILGSGDLVVMAHDGTVKPGERRTVVHYFDEAPASPHKGDIANIDGALSIFDGSEWQPLGGGGAVTWDKIKNKPETFTPSHHEHILGDVDGLGTRLSGIDADLKTAQETANEAKTAADKKYEKPSTGIPLSDIAASVFPPELDSQLESETKAAPAKKVGEELAKKLELVDYGLGPYLDVPSIKNDSAINDLRIESPYSRIILGENTYIKINNELYSLVSAIDLVDKLTDDDLKTLCTTCGISPTKPDGTPKTRAELLIDLFGESNSQLVNTIREKVLADGEGGIKAALFTDTAFTQKVKENANYAVVDTIENRSVKRVTISGDTAMTVILLKPTVTSGVIDFEVWFDASAYTGTYPSIGYKYDATTDADVITKDGEDLAYGDGAVTIVHFTSVNGSAYTAVAASFK